MPQAIAIQPASPFAARLRPPGSKSLTNRALLLAALADGPCALTGVLFADDTQVMLESLTRLGIGLTVDKPNATVSVQGMSGRVGVDDTDLYVRNAGTAMRALTAACCLWPGRFKLDGNDRMRHRPIGELVDPLRSLGASIAYLGHEGFPPLEVRGSQISGGSIEIGTTLSSQFITALLIIGPYLPGGLTINFTGSITSRSYVDMTVGLTATFAITAEVDASHKHITVKPGRYRALDYGIEPDASSASYFLAAAAVTPESRCTIEGLGKASLQGDIGFADILHQMGAGLSFGPDFITVIAPPTKQRLRGIEIDLNRMPDMALTLAAIAPLCEGKTTIRNVGNLRVKETDRLAALTEELQKVGATATVSGDDLFITPPPGNQIRPAAIDTYDDHRIAMSFAILGLAAGDAKGNEPAIVINDPACINKTFPDFFDYLDRLRDSV